MLYEFARNSDRRRRGDCCIRYLATSQKPLTGIPAANWPVTGRWVIGWRDGRIYDPMIGKRPSLKGEAPVGWAFHYLIGAAYAALYLSVVVVIAKTVPTLLNGLLFGLVTLLAPFLFMKPALGGGFFGLRLPILEKDYFSVSALMRSSELDCI